MRKPAQVQKEEAGRRLVAWYQANKRDLPWRHTSDPYRIWVSEIMLQQTRVETVIDYYLRFISQFPDIAALAAAPREEVLRAWQGLGYYSRARHLHEAAAVIMAEHDGRFPNTLEAVCSLPGIGPYTAGAILSIAFNQPVPAVDGNVLRVTARLTGLQEDVQKPATRRIVTEEVRAMMTPDCCGDFTQAMMELGALICTPSSPQCGLCPLADDCAANQTGQQYELPIRAKAKPVREIEYLVALIEKDGYLLMEYRQEKLLGEMWGFPMVLLDEKIPINELFQPGYAFTLQAGEDLGIVTHTFTHLQWNMRVMRFVLCGSPAKIAPPLDWIPLAELNRLPIPVAFQKVISAAGYSLNSPSAR